MPIGLGGGIELGDILNKETYKYMKHYDLLPKFNGVLISRK